MYLMHVGGVECKQNKLLYGYSIVKFHLARMGLERIPGIKTGSL